MGEQRRLLKKHEEKGDIYIEQEYVGDTFVMQPWLSQLLNEHDAARVHWLYLCSVEELKLEYDQRNLKVEGSFAEALASRKRAA